MAPKLSQAGLKARGQVAALSRSRSSDDPELLEARQNLKSEQISSYIESLVSSAPPLRPEQVERITAIVRGGLSA